MIPRLADSLEATPWQKVLAEAIRNPRDLLRLLGLEEHYQPAADGGFPTLVTRSYASRMRRGDPDDPLLLQVLPSEHESTRIAGYAQDPVGDLEALRSPGLLHKYRGRALLLGTGACAVHCRYCFRRHFPYADYQLTGERLAAAMAYLRSDDSIHEVILSGGDPLLMSNRRIEELLASLEAIDHLRRVRIHTRLPIVLPERVDQGLVRQLTNRRIVCVVVVHANHANELDSDVARSLSALHGAGITLFNQSVLLRRVNDDVATLCNLSERLFALRVVPYYLHQLDKVHGAAHFQVSDRRARRLVEEVRSRLPGYLVPRLVRENAGAHAKQLLK